jgi:hypothetical protein
MITADAMRGRGFKVSTFVHVPNSITGVCMHAIITTDPVSGRGFKVSTFVHVP